MATAKKPNKKSIDQMVLELLGDERVKALSNQAACEVNGGMANILQGACAASAGMHKGEAAHAAQAAIIVIQACGSKAKRADLEALMKATGTEPVALRHLRAKENRTKKKAAEAKAAKDKK